MEIKADLHTHTNYSDGALSPTELLNLAKKKNLSVLAVTDHDSVEGIDEAIEAGKKLGIEVVPGLEISTDVDGDEIHLLGYFINHKDRELKSYLKFFRNERNERAKRIIKKLKKMGVEINIEEVKEVAKSSPICRPHIAQVLLKKKIVKSYLMAFQKYIGDYAPATEKKIYVSPQSAIKIINDAGGIAILAHPGKMKEKVLTKLIEFGIDGIEVIHPSHKKNQQKFYKGIVQQYCLLGTGGSDFHGGLRNDEKNFGSFYIPLRNFEQIKHSIGKD